MRIDEMKAILTQFDTPMPVATASLNTYGQVRHFAVPGLIADAYAEGYLVDVDGHGKVVNSDKVYTRDLMLTDKGREFCGLDLMAVPVVKPKARTLFD